MRLESGMIGGLIYGILIPYSIPLTKEDREYAYMTRAYSNLFETASFYFLLYFVVNFAWLVGAMAIEIFEVGPSWNAMAVRTPLFGGWSAPTVLVLAVAFIAFQAAYSWYLGEFLSLFADWGTYCRFAARYQRESGGFAVGIWGTVTEDNRPIRDIRIGLIQGGQLFREVRTDEEGRFKFPGVFQSCTDRTCVLRCSRGASFQEWAIEITLKTVPEFHVVLDEGSWEISGERPPMRSRLVWWLLEKALGERRRRPSLS